MTEPKIALCGPRVRLRPGTEADAPVVFSIRCEPEVRRWWRSPPPVEELARELLGNDDAVQFVIVVDGEVAGLVQYGEEADPEYRHASIDIFLSARVHGRGLGTETVAVLAAYLIDGLGHHRITIDPSAANTAAIRAYTKAGFRPVGLLRRYERDEDGQWHDGLLMDLLADELVRAERTGHPRATPKESIGKPRQHPDMPHRAPTGGRMTWSPCAGDLGRVPVGPSSTVQ